MSTKLSAAKTRATTGTPQPRSRETVGTYRPCMHHVQAAEELTREQEARREMRAWWSQVLDLPL